MITNKTYTKEEFFLGSNKPMVASSPGRMDIMGGIADYSGSLVLESPIKESTTVSISKNDSSHIKVYSHTINEEIIADVKDIVNNDYSILRAKFEKSWVLYVLGCIAVLAKEKNIPISGMSIWVDSEVPLGKGVSSSAAIEVATMKALDKMYNLNLGDTELPILAQKVENLVVGAPCGLMDQLTSYLGEENKLLPILCQPDTVYPSISLPDDIYFVGIDSGIRHAVVGASYVDVRTAAFMGYSIIADSLGVQKETCAQVKLTNNRDNIPYKGYLANINPTEYTQKYVSILPDKMTGEEFLSSYHSIDSVTSVDENKTYSVKICTQHPIFENYRVNTFQSLLKSFPTDIQQQEKTLQQMGELMYQSHNSYSMCGLGNENTDLLVAYSKELGNKKKVYGAKITGGGSGGTVVFLVKGQEGFNAIDQIVEQYKNTTKINPYIFKGSSMGGKFNK